MTVIPAPRTLFVASLAVILTGLVFAAAHKGIWYDEMWSMFMARHDLPLGPTYSQRWSYDVHPPLFSFTSWLFEPVTGESIVA